MKMPLISVVIPTYNRAGIIGETLQSVLDQSYETYEVIVVDDGSTDTTEQAVLSFHDPRIRYHRQGHLGLPATARNCGMGLARGEYIAFLDSDDQWKPQKLEKQLQALERYPHLLAVSCNIDTFPNGVHSAYGLDQDLFISFTDFLTRRVSICNSSVLMKRDVIPAIGWLDPDPALRAVEDCDYWLRILRYRDRSILCLKESLVAYRVHEANISTTKQTRIDEHRKVMRVYRKHRDYAPASYYRMAFLIQAKILFHRMKRCRLQE